MCKHTYADVSMSPALTVMTFLWQQAEMQRLMEEKEKLAAEAAARYLCLSRVCQHESVYVCAVECTFAHVYAYPPGSFYCAIHV
jgi:hypothetical protein